MDIERAEHLGKKYLGIMIAEGIGFFALAGVSAANGEAKNVFGSAILGFVCESVTGYILIRRNNENLREVNISN